MSRAAPHVVFSYVQITLFRSLGLWSRIVMAPAQTTLTSLSNAWRIGRSSVHSTRHRPCSKKKGESGDSRR